MRVLFSRESFSHIFHFSHILWVNSSKELFNPQRGEKKESKVMKRSRCPCPPVLPQEVGSRSFLSYQVCVFQSLQWEFSAVALEEEHACTVHATLIGEGIGRLHRGRILNGLAAQKWGDSHTHREMLTEKEARIYACWDREGKAKWKRK